MAFSRQSLYDPNNPEMAAKKAALDAMMPGEPPPDPAARHIMGSGGLAPSGDVGDEEPPGGSVIDPNQGPMFRGPDGTMVSGRSGAPVGGGSSAGSEYGGPGIGISQLINTLSNNEQSGAVDRYGASPLFTNILEQTAEAPETAPMMGPEADLKDAMRAMRTGSVSPYRRRALDSLLGGR